MNDVEMGQQQVSVETGAHVVFEHVLFMGMWDATANFGGAVSVTDQSTFECIRCLFWGNVAYHLGGAVNIEDSSASFVSSVMLDNRADNIGGGAIHVKGASTLTMTNCVVQDNASARGGGVDGVQLSLANSVSFTKTNFKGNTAESNNGGA